MPSATDDIGLGASAAAGIQGSGARTSSPTTKTTEEAAAAQRIAPARTSVEAGAQRFESAQMTFETAPADGESRAGPASRADAGSSGRRPFELEVAIDAPTVQAAETASETRESLELTTADAVKAAGTTVTAGLLWWLTRGGGMLTMMLMGIPAWRHMDLLPVLARQLDEEDGDDEGDDADDGDDDGEAEDDLAWHLADGHAGRGPARQGPPAEQDFGDLFSAGAAGAGEAGAARATGGATARGQT